jgi:hypothetical protein
MVRIKYSAAPATARKIPKRLAELNPKFTIIAFRILSIFNITLSLHKGHNENQAPSIVQNN